MTAAPATSPDISPEFVARLAERAQEAERPAQAARAPPSTTSSHQGSPNCSSRRATAATRPPLPAILDPVRRMAHGCTSSAWTIGFYALHNWMLALFGEQAQEEAFATRPFLAPAPLAPTGRGVPADGGIRLTGRWSWATGVMARQLDHRRRPVRAGRRHLPGAGAAAHRRRPHRGRLAHRRHVRHRLERRRHRRRLRPRAIGWCASPTSTRAPRPARRLHDADTYRWPMVPALALLAAMPALGSAERVADIYAERLSERVLAYEGVTQKDKPIAQAHLGEARVRLRALRGPARRHRRPARNHRCHRRSRASAGARRGTAGRRPHRARVAGA